MACIKENGKFNWSKLFCAVICVLGITTLPSFSRVMIVIYVFLCPVLQFIVSCTESSESQQCISCKTSYFLYFYRMMFCWRSTGLFIYLVFPFEQFFKLQIKFGRQFCIRGWRVFRRRKTLVISCCRCVLIGRGICVLFNKQRFWCTLFRVLNPFLMSILSLFLTRVSIRLNSL